jgi:hypothetical protein
VGLERKKELQRREKDHVGKRIKFSNTMDSIKGKLLRVIKSV